MKKIWTGLWTALLASALAHAQSRAEIFSGIQSYVAQVSEFTGLAPLKKVQYDTISRTGLKKFLEDRIREEVDPEEIRIEELALKRMGLVPRDFDLRKTTVDLMTEQAEAFYDYRKKKLFLLDGGYSPAQEAVLIHELAHALADQHFHLEKYLKRGKSDDASLARMAVMEGQATWLMYESLAHKMGQSLKTSPVIARTMAQASDTTALSQYPVLQAAPLYMRASLLFPYTRGMTFQQAVIEKFGNNGFGEVFRNPPESTQQILHPDQYFSHVRATSPDLPELENSSGYRGLSDGNVGEFDHSILIEQYADKETAGELSPKWRGGRYRLLEGKKAPKQVVLLYSSDWEDAAAARRMFDVYRKAMESKWNGVSWKQVTADVAEGTGEFGWFRIRCIGNRLTSVEGLAGPIRTNSRP